MLCKVFTEITAEMTCGSFVLLKIEGQVEHIASVGDWRLLKHISWILEIFCFLKSVSFSVLTGSGLDCACERVYVLGLCTVGCEVRWASVRGRHVEAADSAADKNRITARRTAVQRCWWGRSDDKSFMAVWGRGNDMLLINSCARHRLFFGDNRRTALLFSFYMMPISDVGKICPCVNLLTFVTTGTKPAGLVFANDALH